MVKRLAELAGLDVGLVVASIRAEREADSPMGVVWASVAGRLAQAGAAAAVACLAVTGTPDAMAGTFDLVECSALVCILCKITSVP